MEELNSIWTLLQPKDKKQWRHDTQHNDTQDNDIQRTDAQRKRLICDTQYNDIQPMA